MLNRLVLAGLVAILTATELSAQMVVLDNLLRRGGMVPGEVRREVVRIQNTSAAPIDVVLEKKQLERTCGGSRQVLPAAAAVTRSNAPWLTLGRTSLTIGPGQIVPIELKLAVPARETREGSFYSLVMIRTQPTREATASRGKSKVQVALRTNMIFGVMLVTDLGNAPPAQVEIVDRKLVKDATGFRLVLELANPGDFMLQASATVELYGPKGEKLGTFPGERDWSLPGQCLRLAIPLGRDRRGPCKALVVIDCGGNAVFGASYDLEF